MRIVSAGLLAVIYLTAQVLGRLVHQSCKKDPEILQAFATVHAGLLLAAACFELLPLSLDSARWTVALTGLAAGAGCWISAKLYSYRGKRISLSALLQTVCLGLALGAAYAPAERIGKKFLLVLFLAAFLQSVSESKTWKGYFWQTATVLLGTVVGQLAGEIGIELGGACLAFAGSFLIIASYQYLLPGKNKMETSGAGSTILGLLLGLGITFL